MLWEADVSKKSGVQKVYWGVAPLKRKREGSRIGQRELSDHNTNLTRSTLGRVSSYLGLLGNFPDLVLKVVCPGKTFSPVN
jgi:hypothetical protein